MGKDSSPCTPLRSRWVLRNPPFTCFAMAPLRKRSRSSPCTPLRSQWVLRNPPFTCFAMAPLRKRSRSLRLRLCFATNLLRATRVHVFGEGTQKRRQPFAGNPAYTFFGEGTRKPPPFCRGGYHPPAQVCAHDNRYKNANMPQCHPEAKPKDLARKREILPCCVRMTTGNGWRILSAPTE